MNNEFETKSIFKLNQQHVSIAKKLKFGNLNSCFENLNWRFGNLNWHFKNLNWTPTSHKYQLSEAPQDQNDGFYAAEHDLRPFFDNVKLFSALSRCLHTLAMCINRAFTEGHAHSVGSLYRT